MRVEGARLVAISLSALGHGALIGWLAGGMGTAIEPAEPIAVALVVEAPPASVAAPAPAVAAADPAPPTEARAAPPVEPTPPTEPSPPQVPAAVPSPAPPQVAAVPVPQPAPAPLAKPAPAATEPAPTAPEQLTLVAPAAGGATSSAPNTDPAPAAAAPNGNAVAALSPKEAAPLAGGNAPPVYPLAARRQGIQGRVILDVAVDVSGRATEVKIARTSGSRLLDDAALAAVRGWRFTPATVGGVPIASKVQVPVTFRLDAPG